MSSIEPFIPENVDPNSSYLATCINRVNTNWKLALASIPDFSTLSAQVTTNTNNIATLTTKMNFSYKVINVKDYGVVGDGVNDDTTLINTAISLVPSSYGILYFPKGKYKISATININQKNNLMIVSDNAEIFVTQTSASAFYISDCNNVEAVVGNMTLTTNSSGASTFKIAFIYNNVNNSANPTIANIKVIGAFYYGMYINNHNNYYSNGTITNFMMDGQNTGTNGIYLSPSCQYFEVIGCKISNLLGTGVIVEGGNNTITGGNITNCRIGIFVNSIGGGNVDHGLINGTTCNHNRACGIFMRSLQLNHAITNCKIWASNGGDNLTEASNTTARGFHYGVYLENVKGLIMTGNTIAHNNQVELAFDGLNTSIINNNLFRSVNTTLYAIYEWGTGSGSTNFEVQFCNNVFSGITANASGRWGRFFLGNTGNDSAKSFIIKDNSIENGNNQLLMDTNSGDYNIGFHNNYVIDGSVIKTSSSTDPNTQTANIYIMPHATGTYFKLSFRAFTATNFTWIRYKTNNTSLVPYILGYNISYSTALKAFRIGPNAINTLEFIPADNTSLGNWCIISAIT